MSRLMLNLYEAMAPAAATAKNTTLMVFSTRIEASNITTVGPVGEQGWAGSSGFPVAPRRRGPEDASEEAEVIADGEVMNVGLAV
ncbi:hypothetical protein BV25DRAFT_1825985 [Artomyces pyxidatus]|uniref:Uncharacterized protein n=1 Tax=Artomyces pyxidatus TaxID=48021 RepID=A0ACB8T276_9AGAM|nr:hypothetical protein BV25DRAFT_1825985 [Artomyces pyxidatus]